MKKISDVTIVGQQGINLIERVTYTISVGSSSRDIRLEGTLTIPSN
jgi:hypothetical protein